MSKTNPINKCLQPPLRAVPMSLFPAMETLDDAVHYCKSHFPKSDSQKLVGLLMLYHNTLIDQLNQEK